LVKIISESGHEEKFDHKDVESKLKAAGFPEEVAEIVAERVEDRVADRWTVAQVNQQIDVELKRLEEDIQRAHNTFKAETTWPETGRLETSSSETFVPEKDTKEHRH
jgi:hypothetical protein